MNITRNVLPVIIAALVAMLILTGLEHYTFHLFPLPAGTDMYDEESAQKAIKSLPVQALYMQLANYAVSSFLGGVLATLLAKRERRWPAITVGIVLTLGGIINSLTLHEPTWFFVASLFTYLPFTLLGYFITRKNKKP
jgi:hypothetical protein